MVSEKAEHVEMPFLDYFKQSRFLKAALAFNVFYYAAVVVVYAWLLLTGSVTGTEYTFDWTVFYEAGQMFQSNPADIYTVNPNGLPYRYLPSFAMLMSYVQWVPLEIAYLLNISFMMFVNLGIVWVVYLICLSSGVTTRTRNFEHMLAVLYIAPQHIVNLILGQISQLVILLILLSVLILQRCNDLCLKESIIVGLLIGLALNLKPFVVLFIPFIIPLYYRSGFSIKLVKALVGVFVGISLTILPSILFFLSFPSALESFLEITFLDTLDIHHSTSITRLLTRVVPFLQDPIYRIGVMLVLSGIIFMKSFIRFIRVPNAEKKYVLHFTEMAFLFLLVYPDSWFLFLAFWYAFLGPSMVVLYAQHEGHPRKVHLLDKLFSGSNNLLAFFVGGVLIHYLVLGFDPFIPIILLILYVLFQMLLDPPNEIEKR
jgi:hypothetical protein